jgi:SAM domain (Sterile alpha motif)
LFPWWKSRSGPEGIAVSAMQQIADWLEKLGMPEYAERFAENDIDTSILPELTDQDLKAYGQKIETATKTGGYPERPKINTRGF